MAAHTIIFASNNQHKADEIKQIIGNGFTILTLKDAGINIDIPEPFDTLEANASEKAATIHKMTGKNCFSEDTGLEVEALNGEPGVKSARYAGDSRDFNANINKLLANMQGKQQRSACFRTVIALIWHTHEYCFEGECKGKIIETPRGDKGFGYDPVFIPEGSDKTFAEMTMDEKNEFSHRRKAVDKLVEFLKGVDEQQTRVPVD
ncbi:MAG TPA: RdgB/HAM1 family non-canonical purine NTP pyrophosphatase [Chitinophagaceae bacterium]|nr:RdgB/HAM1 family non-canonical purine NTP pyrophosphatase [Chitinophagaceae bacterium]